MPRRDVHLTVVLGDGPNPDNSWDAGIAVSADGHDEWGMVIGKVASNGDDILGWTIRNQESGDVTTLRTMFDGTLDVKLGPGVPTELLTYVGDDLWLMDDESGRMTKYGLSVAHAETPIALALEAGKGENEFCEIFVYSQKFAYVGD